MHSGDARLKRLELGVDLGQLGVDLADEGDHDAELRRDVIHVAHRRLEPRLSLLAPRCDTTVLQLSVSVSTRLHRSYVITM